MTRISEKQLAVIEARGVTVHDRWRKNETERVQIMLPIPPSVNGAWANVPGIGRVRSQPYRRWHKAAMDELTLQKPGRVYGKFVIDIEVGRIRRRADIDNRAKPLLDLLANLVTDDDAVCESLTIRWSDDVQPERARVTVVKA